MEGTACHFVNYKEDDSDPKNIKQILSIYVRAPNNQFKEYQCKYTNNKLDEKLKDGFYVDVNHI